MFCCNDLFPDLNIHQWLSVTRFHILSYRLTTRGYNNKREVWITLLFHQLWKKRKKSWTSKWMCTDVTEERERERERESHEGISYVCKEWNTLEYIFYALHLHLAICNLNVVLDLSFNSREIPIVFSFPVIRFFQLELLLLLFSCDWSLTHSFLCLPHSNMTSVFVIQHL